MSDQPDSAQAGAEAEPEAAKLAAGPVNAPGVGQSATPRAAAAAGQDASATPGGAPAAENAQAPAPATSADGDSADGEGGLADRLPPQLAGVAAKIEPQYEQISKDKPELLLAGAFAAGFVVAKVLRLLGR